MASKSVEQLEASRAPAARRRRALPILPLCVIGGILIALPGEDVLLTGIAVFLLGAAAVYAVSLVFYEIGTAEDLDRARTRRDRGG